MEASEVEKKARNGEIALRVWTNDNNLSLFVSIVFLFPVDGTVVFFGDVHLVNKPNLAFRRKTENEPN